MAAVAINAHMGICAFSGELAVPCIPRGTNGALSGVRDWTLPFFRGTFRVRHSGTRQSWGARGSARKNCCHCALRRGVVEFLAMLAGDGYPVSLAGDEHLVE